MTVCSILSSPSLDGLRLVEEGLGRVNIANKDEVLAKI